MRNIEIKARSSEENHKNIRAILVKNNADYAGKDHQIDTYFAVPNGRLKLREGEIENFLVQYSRDDKSGPKLSNVVLTPVTPEIRTPLKDSLTKSVGVLQIVEKYREIYYQRVTVSELEVSAKIHLDNVPQLGLFVEIEIRDDHDTISLYDMETVCQSFMTAFGINQSDLITNSYSDILLERHK